MYLKHGRELSNYYMYKYLNVFIDSDNRKIKLESTKEQFSDETFLLMTANYNTQDMSLTLCIDSKKKKKLRKRKKSVRFDSLINDELGHPRNIFEQREFWEKGQAHGY